MDDTEFIIHRSARFGGQIENDGNMIVEGHTFFSEPQDQNKGLICITGEASLHEDQDEQYVNEKVNSCGESDAEIVVLNQDVSAPDDKDEENDGKSGDEEGNDGDDWNIEFGDVQY